MSAEEVDYPEFSQPEERERSARIIPFPSYNDIEFVPIEFVPVKDTPIPNPSGSHVLSEEERHALNNLDHTQLSKFYRGV